MAKRENIIRAYERAVEQLFSDKVTFADYLDFSGRFYKLPSSQTIMIFDDNPNAKMVADFDTWQQFGRRIKPGGWSTDVLDNGKIKRLYDISMTRGDKTPYQWSLNKKTAEEFSDRLSKSEDRNFTGMSDCIYHLADNAVRERFEDVVNLLDIPEKDEDIFRKSFASMVRRVIAARCEWGSDFTYGGTGAVKGVDLSALDFLDNSEDMETLLEEVQITAKNVLKSMERSINDIIFERSIDNERNERVDRTRGIDIGRGGSSSVVRGGEDVFAVDNDTERENVQARREDVSVQPDDGVVSDGRGTGADDEPNKPLGESVAEIYDGEPPVGYTEPAGKIFVGADTAQNRQGGVGDLGENTGGISSDEPAPDIGERNSLGGTAESNDRGTDNGVSGERAEDGTVISENNENTLTAENNSAVNYLSLKIAELSDAFEKKYNGDYKEFTLANYAFTHVGAEYDLNLSVRNNAENMLRGGQQAYLKEYLNAVFKEAFEGRVIVDEGIVAGELMSRLVKSDRKKNAEPLTADITASADGSEQLRLFPEPLDKKQQAELDKLTSDLKKEFENWENILLDGNTDPFYEDGVSLDLIRNHIIHDKSILEEKFPDNLPEIYHKETPPEYPFTYQSVKKGDTLRFEYGDYTVLNIEKTTGTGEYFVELQDENGEIITQNLREIKTKFRNLTNHGEAPNRADARNTIQAVSENVSPVTRELSVDFVPYNEQKVISASKIGDFYEFYGETAKELSEKFSLTLTKRNGEPMVGVPAYSFDDFCSELYDKGYIVENWGHYQEVIKPQVAKSPSLTRAEELINEYCEREHDSEGDFSNPQRVGLAYTNDEETGLPIEVYADLELFRIVTEFNNVIVAEEQYNSLDEMCNMALNNLSFGELVYLPEEQRKKGIEKNFDEAQLELPGNVDKFYINKENESVTWVYYNADSDKGGQLVYHHFTFDQLFDNLFKDDVAEAITQVAKTELVDADDPAFKEHAQDFLADNEDFSFSGEWDRHKLSAVVEPIYAISQLFSSADAERNGNDILRDYRFASLSDLQQRGLYVDRENYRTVYRGRLKDGETLEDIYTKFNVNHPTDFRGHSLSVGDIVVIRQDGKPTAHYVDSVGFEEVRDFFLDREERIAQRALTERSSDKPSEEQGRFGEQLILFDEQIHEEVSNEEKVSPVSQFPGDVISDFREKTNEYYNKLGGYSAHDAEELVKYFIRAAIRENELSAEVGEVVLYGSRSRGMENDNSDLDFVAEMYSDLKEDTLFNILHETPFEIGGVTVDINPIRTEESGSLEDYLIGAEQYLQQKGAKDNNAPAVQDYRVEETEQTSFGQKSRYAANIAAIKTLLQIEGENRTATPDEQKVLAQYVGWGGIPSVFDSDNTAWAAEYAELKELLAPDEYEAARSTVLTAHYTSPTIISAVYSALDKFGFKGGNVLEPSMGIGNFFGVMPDEMRSQSHLHGVELDDISGRIAKQLYPNADIQICGYENTAFSDNFFDAAVGNVPFGNYTVADTRYDREHFLIHDYFFAKTLDKVAPGGVVAFITSKGTLDKTNPKVREYLAKRADLIGAIRLPDNAFKANAGTEVTADIVFLQKREKLSTEKPDWCYTAEIAEGISVNQYFVDHPEMILGEMQLVSGRYGEETTCIPIEGADLKELLNAAIMRLSRDIITVRREDKRNEEHGIIPATADVRNFTFTEVNDKIYFRENNIMREIPFSKRNHERMRGMIGIRNTFRELVDAQSEGCSDETLSGLQFRLNSEYDAFVINWGHISDIDNRKVFAVDDDYNTLCGALELIDPETKEVTKADIFTKRTIKPYVEVTHVDTPQEALFVSLDMRGFADIDYMAELCGASNDEVINELTEGGFIYKNPETENYEEAAEYLSGYVREKLRQAQDASADNPEYERNVAALEKALPPKLGAGDISVRLGAPWITIDDYCKFFNEYAQGAVSKGSYFSRDTVLYRSVSGEYKIENKNADKSVAAQSSFGTKRMNSYAIFENLLNNRDIAVYDTSELPDGKKKRVMNKDETQLAQEKARQMKEAFPKWLWSDPERREKYVEIYNDLFNSLVGREYDGSHQTFPGMNPFIELNEHQKNAVMRAKLGGNTLLAHCVGAGKTFEMAAAVMEKRRLGLINKACIVVPKHLVGQMSAEWLRLYPEARLLTAKENDFNDVNRQKFIGRCCTGDYDAVIMSYQQFQKIPMSIEYQKEFLTEQLSSLTEQLQDFSGYLSADDKRSVKDLERMKKNTEAKLKRLLDTPHDNSLNFEQLGFDCIVADEAHNYKNGLVVTKMKNVSGIGSRAAKKSEDFLMKTRYLNEKFGERNLILASGTPVSNSMTELYIMQQYLRPSALRRQGLQNFDDWASTFGEVVSQLELKPAGDGFRMKKRFAKFTNLPELMQAFKNFADIRTAEMLNLPVPEVESGKPQVISAKPNEFQQAYMKVLADRSEAIHSGSVDPSVDNMLKITNEARLLGLDARTINPDADNYPNSKVNLLIEKVMEIYTETTAQKGVQAIFCDIAINDGKKDINEIAIEIEEQSDDNEKTLSAEELSELLTASKFSVYKYIKEELIRRGIPEAEICFAGDAKDQGQRGELYAQLRAGTKRIVLASTTKMGTGANIQTRLCALHNLDIPWKPSDFEQRIGRIVRQGNKFPTVKIFNYVTEGTFDAYMLNLIVTKQKFISQLMSGKTPARTCEDVDELVLNYSEMQAIASGDPRIKEKIQLDTDVSRLRLLENEHLNKKYQLEDKVTFCQSQISIAKKQLALASDDKEFAVKNALPEGEFKITLNGKIFTERKEAGAELRKAQMAFLSKKQATVIGEYRGFKMSLNWGLVSMNQYTVSVDLTKPDKGLRYSTELELQNDLGNITRLENILKHGIDKRISGLQADLARNEKDLAEALRTKDAPFEYADELAQKSLRLAQLDAELGVGKKDEIIIDDENQEDDRGRGRDNNSPDKNRMPKRPKR